MLTYGGVYYNLNESDFCVNIEGFTFYFSSKLYKNKFKNNVRQFIKNESEKINSKYQININLDLYLMIAFYMKVEKRGFKIVDEQTKKEITRSAGFINQLISY